ncbi:MAG: 2-hydroxychromene-2-carboxylate isomerase [Granulosicoccaceae bacterium]
MSPWSYLAIDRFNTPKEKYGLVVRYKPINVMQTFDKMGGLPPGKRHPSRQRFRMEELKRWSAYLQVPMNFTPAHCPADQTLAAQIVFAAGGADGNVRAGAFSDAILTACWASDENIADEATLLALAEQCGLDGSALAQSTKQPVVAQLYCDTTSEAHAAEVFGSPTYKVGGELFWGQDRLEFLDSALPA